MARPQVVDRGINGNQKRPVCFPETQVELRVIDGDFNAKIDTLEERHIGTHGLEWNEQEREMKILASITRHPIDPFVISLLATTSTALCCGVMPAGQASTRTFKVSGFTTLPVAMVYAGKREAAVQVSGIASSEEGAKSFVQNLVMQTIEFTILLL
ncbi:hypothetical protein KIN20_030870 [Parelaphostrongylus tenuis]|uniref:Uncharacterized protein n=1 Tax=Parelaphostrongylus tenuis TaxID=148309 RepID=A0AAD5R609_PARTN|nr:hypothetical protein KIN20_030870 [Parelaphostrongylus tenuis]